MVPPLTEEHRLEVSENRVLMRISRPKERKIPEGWRVFQQGASYFIPITEDQMGGTLNVHGIARTEMHIKFYHENLKGKDYL